MRPGTLAALFVVIASAAAAQPPSSASSVAEIEARLPTLASPDRARALAELTELLQSDDPKKALTYGALALEAPTQDLDYAERVSTLSSMAWAHMTLSQYDEAIARGEQGLRLAEEHGDENGRADALNHLGSIAQRRGDPVRALDLFTQSLEAGRRGGSEHDIAMSLNNLGFVYATDLADYERGLDHHLQALAIRERLGDEGDVALSLNNIGIVYSRLRQPDRALEYFGRALAMRRRLGPAARMAAILHNIGDVHLERGDLDEALKAHQEALEIRRRVGDRWGMTTSQRAIGLVYLAMKRMADAERELDEALALGDAVGDKALAVRNRLGLAVVDRQSGRPERAVTRAKEALDIATGTAARELQRLSYEELAASQEAAGHPAEALAAYRRFKGLSDEILDEGTARRVASLDKRYEIERREREMERLVSTRSRQRDLAAGAFVILAVGGFAVYSRRAFTARLAERLSVTDALTGLKNRRYVLQTIEADMASSLRRHRDALAGGAPARDADLVFFLVDIDGFKAVNDGYGHAAGDLVLERTSRLLEAACRQSDVVARWGGEEFLVIARFAERAQAAAQAERLRRTVEEGRFTLEDGRVLSITCSLGFAAFPFARQQPEGLGWEQIVAVADHAAYAAKRLGRNAWVGLRLTGEVLPAGKLSPESLDAWISEGRLTVETREASQSAA
jgi:two-component system cell cycle response regulator